MTRGFTLVEMVVVLVILGVTAAAVVPALTRLTPEDGTLPTAHRVERVLTFARAMALERATAVEVIVSPQDARIWLRTDSATIDSGVIDLDSGVTLSSSAVRPRVRFAPTGSAVADSLIVLGPPSPVPISVNAWTGEVHARRP